MRNASAAAESSVNRKERTIFLEGGHVTRSRARGTWRFDFELFTLVIGKSGRALSSACKESAFLTGVRNFFTQVLAHWRTGAKSPCCSLAEWVLRASTACYFVLDVEQFD